MDVAINVVKYFLDGRIRDAWDRSAMFKDNTLGKKHAHSGTHSGKRRLKTTDGRRVALQNQVCKVWDEAMMRGWEKG